MKLSYAGREGSSRQEQVVSFVEEARRGCRRALSMLVGAALACASLGGAALALAGGPPLQSGDTVAIFELEKPSSQTFVLRGTLPLPPRVYPRSDGLSPFQFVDGSQQKIPAQVEIVSRYPSDADGADVVELLARVDLPEGFNGNRLRYEVVFTPQSEAGFAGDPAVDELFGTAGSLRVRTRDVFGHRYSADLLADAQSGGPSARTLRAGHVAQGVATHAMLATSAPVIGPLGTMPHMMGVHAYVTRWREEPFLSLDLRVHNAASGLDQSDPSDDALGQVYFRELELIAPEGWVLLTAFGDPFFGAPYEESGRVVWPFVAPLADNKLHVMPQMSHFQRRFALVREGSEERALAMLREEGLAFSRAGNAPGGGELYSWWNPSTARYFPQRQRLPALDNVPIADLRASDTSHFLARAQQVATGSPGLYPAESPGLGWAHPWGVTDGGAVGGDEIWLFDGVTTAWASSRDGYRMHQLRHRMYADRQTNVLFNKDGRPTSPSQWVVHTPNGDYLPVWWYNLPMLWATDPFGFGLAPVFQQVATSVLGLKPPYEDALLSYTLIDEAHLVRYTHDAKVLVWLGNDELAKDDLLAQAEGIRFAYNMLPQDLWGGIIPSGLLAARQYVDAHPGTGLAYGRGEAWGLDVMNATYSFMPPAWRYEVKPWFEQVSQVIADGQSTCTGIIQATPLFNVFDGQYRCRQSIESAITENALVGMRESVFTGEDGGRVAQIDEVLRRSAYSMLSPDVWDSAQHGPRILIAVGPVDPAQPPFCSFAIPETGAYGGADHYQVWSTFAYAWQITQDPAFLHAAQEMSGGNLSGSLAANQLNNINNRAPLLALVQRLGIDF